MTYDPALPTTRDKIRLLVGDTDTTAELLPDATYDAAIAAYGETWKLAAAEMAEAVAVAIERQVSSFSAGGEITVGWSDRTRTLRALAVRLRQEAATDALGAITTVALEREGSGTTPEYTTRRYVTLRR